jgi:RNA 2',3'-cyclic 3'-phosphodiesterase
MKRLFVGLRFDAEILAKLDPPIRKIKRVIEQHEIEGRWTKPENLHITLLFIGETAEPDIEPLNQKLRALATETACFPIRIEGAGAFPDAREARMIWLGVRKSKDLMELQNKIAITIGKGPTDYVPHITLARLRNKKNVWDTIKPFARESWGKVEVQEVVLFESILAGPIPIYKALEVIPLKPLPTD